MKPEIFFFYIFSHTYKYMDYVLAFQYKITTLYIKLLWDNYIIFYISYFFKIHIYIDCFFNFFDMK
jgi:hypothetical protein